MSKGDFREFDPLNGYQNYAPLAELADALDLGSSAARCVRSTRTGSTSIYALVAQWTQSALLRPRMSAVLIAGGLSCIFNVVSNLQYAAVAQVDRAAVF